MLALFDAICLVYPNDLIQKTCEYGLSYIMINLYKNVTRNIYFFVNPLIDKKIHIMLFDFNHDNSDVNDSIYLSLLNMRIE